jgi:hypothetical protein
MGPSIQGREEDLGEVEGAVDPDGDGSPVLGGQIQQVGLKSDAAPTHDETHQNEDQWKGAGTQGAEEKGEKMGLPLPGGGG